MIRPFRKDEDIKKLFHVLEAWLDESRSQVRKFGIETDVTEYIDEVNELIHSEDHDLLVMEVAGKIIGLMGLTTFKNPLGKQIMANAHYWYILQNHRGKGISFIKEARNWARGKKCSHIIFNSSVMASELHYKVCQIYELLGMKKFETSYIEKIKKT